MPLHAMQATKQVASTAYEAAFHQPGWLEMGMQCNYCCKLQPNTPKTFTRNVNSISLSVIFAVDNYITLVICTICYIMWNLLRLTKYDLFLMKICKRKYRSDVSTTQFIFLNHKLKHLSNSLYTHNMFVVFSADLGPTCGC